MVIGLSRVWGKIWSWHAFRMVCCHTVLSMLMAEASCAWYCVTLVVGGGNDVIMACWNVWRLSASLCPPHALCRSCFFVIWAPMALLPDHVFGSWWMSVLMWWSFVDRASMRWGDCGWVVLRWRVGGSGGRVTLFRFACFCWGDVKGILWGGMDRW